jgi:AraC-like DNA-binding protein
MSSKTCYCDFEEVPGDSGRPSKVVARESHIRMVLGHLSREWMQRVLEVWQSVADGWSPADSVSASAALRMFKSRAPLATHPLEDAILRAIENSLAGITPGDAGPLQDSLASDRRLRVAVQFVYTNYARQNLNETMVASVVGLSRGAFSRLFHRHFAGTFRQLVSSTRLTQAARLLSETTCSVKEITYLVGYKSVSEFDRQFKTTFGMSPKQFRRHTCDAVDSAVTHASGP